MRLCSLKAKRDRGDHQRPYGTVMISSRWPSGSFHFDWTSSGRRVGTFNKITQLRDHYVIEIDEPALDRRLAIAQSVALDALQSR